MRTKSLYVLGLILLTFWAFLLTPLQLDILNDPYSVVLEDNQGNLLSAQIAKDEQWRFPMSNELPQIFIKCMTAYEDQRFFSHWGIDPYAIVRAIRQNIKARKVVSGASTISMQLIRMSRRNRNRTIGQKLIEAALALKLEWKYSKSEIFGMYAAHAPFGGNVIGLEAASWKYYNKKADNLSWAQTATLAVLPNSPSLVKFNRNRSKLLEKRNFLLRKLNKLNVLSDTDLELALEEELNYENYVLPSHAPHLLELAKKENKTGRIATTINGQVQKEVNTILNRHYELLAQNEVHNAAVIIMNTKNSEMIAYAANVPTTSQESSVDMIQARRSSGSILKPFLYAAMMDEGLIMPHSFIKDTPIFIDGFRPGNYDRSFSGVLPTSEALRKSLNVPFVLLLQKYGVEKFKRKLNQIGFKTIKKPGGHYGLSLILGGAEVRLSELVTSYAHMGRQLYEYDVNRGQYPSEIYETAYYSRSNLTGNKVKSSLSKDRVQSFRAASIYHTFEAMKKLELVATASENVE